MSAGGEWVEAADVAEFAATDRKLVQAGGHAVGLFLHEGEYLAMSVWCSHQKASLLQGEVADGAIECPLHGARFELKTGRPLCLPAVQAVPVYETRVEGGKVLIRLPP